MNTYEPLSRPPPIAFANTKNAYAASKTDHTNKRRRATRADARQAIFAWINRYNTRRLHSSLGYRSPVDFETDLTRQADQAA